MVSNVVYRPLTRGFVFSISEHLSFCHLFPTSVYKCFQNTFNACFSFLYVLGSCAGKVLQQLDYSLICTSFSLKWLGPVFLLKVYAIKVCSLLNDCVAKKVATQKALLGNCQQQNVEKKTLIGLLTCWRTQEDIV